MNKNILELFREISDLCSMEEPFIQPLIISFNGIDN
jgi:hypothetical protein